MRVRARCVDAVVDACIFMKCLELSLIFSFRTGHWLSVARV